VWLVPFPAPPQASADSGSIRFRLAVCRQLQLAVSNPLKTVVSAGFIRLSFRFGRLPTASQLHGNLLA
jgi:hypothetical protein